MRAPRTKKPFHREKFRVNWQHPLAPTLGGWLFNEAGGDTAFDISGNGHHGRLTNAPTWALDSILRGSVLTFARSSGLKLVCDGAFSGADQGTCVIAIKQTAFAPVFQQGRVFGFNDAFEIAIGDSGSNNTDIFSSQFLASGTFGATYDPGLSLDTWYQWVITWDYSNTTTKIFFNGDRFITDTTAINTTAPTPSTLYIGDSRDLGQGIDGQIGYLLLSDKVLTDKQVRNAYFNPYEFIIPLRGRVFVPAPAVAAEFQSSQTGTVASTTADLTTSIEMAATPSASISSAAIFTVGADLFSANVSGTITAAAALTTSITAAASESVSINSVAALTVGIDLFAATPSASITAAASLTTEITAAANEVGTLTSVAQLTIGTDLFAASESASISTAAALTTAIPLSASESASINSAAIFTVGADLFSTSQSGSINSVAALTTEITLAASESASITAAATLTDTDAAALFSASVSLSITSAADITTEITMAATPSANISTAAILTIGADLFSAAPVGTLSSVAALTTEVGLAASAIVNLNISANITTAIVFSGDIDLILTQNSVFTVTPVVTPPHRSIYIGADNRAVNIEYEERTIFISSENRIINVTKGE